MLTQAELTKMHRDNAHNAMVDDLPEEMPEEFVEMAIDLAMDSADYSGDSEGWTDCTPYASCAAQAVAAWHAAEADARNAAEDYHERA